MKRLTLIFLILLFAGFAQAIPPPPIPNYVVHDNLVLQQVAKPATVPTATLYATAGNLNGAYFYRVTYVTAYGETEGSEISAGTPSPSNQRINLSAIPLGGPGVLGRKIYRTTGGGSTLAMQLLTTINDNTTTTYADNVADGSLGAYENRINTTGGAIYDGTQRVFYASAGTVLVGTNGPAAVGYSNTLVGSGIAPNATTMQGMAVVGQGAVATATDLYVRDTATIGQASLALLRVGEAVANCGYAGMYNLDVGNYNSGLGAYNGFGLTNGTKNVFAGYYAGAYLGNGTTPLTTPNYSTYIGANSKGYSQADTNAIVIGYNAVGEGDNTTVIGNSSTTSTHIFGSTLITSSVEGPTLTLGNADRTNYLEFYKTGLPTSERGSVGALGSFEMNMAYNMDYKTGVHKYYDLTKNAWWIALAHGGFYLQYAPSASKAADIWTDAGSPVPFQVTYGTTGGVGFFTESVSAPSGVFTTTVKLGATPATSGLPIRLSYSGGIVSRDSTNAYNRIVLDYGATITDTVTLGENGIAGINFNPGVGTTTAKAINTSYGNSILINGQDWTGATGATPPTGWAIVNAGVFTITASGDSGNYLSIAVNAVPTGTPSITQVVTTVANQWYKVSYAFKKGTASGGTFCVGTSIGGTQYYNSNPIADAAWATRYVIFKATTATTYITLINNSSTAGETAGFDTVTMTAMPLVQGDDIPRWNNGGKTILMPTDSDDYSHFRSFTSRTLSNATMYVVGGTSVSATLYKCTNVMASCTAISAALPVNAAAEGTFLSPESGTLSYGLVAGDRVKADITVTGAVTSVTIDLGGTIP